MTDKVDGSLEDLLVRWEEFAERKIALQEARLAGLKETLALARERIIAGLECFGNSRRRGVEANLAAVKEKEADCLAYLFFAEQAEASQD
jgi:hypothetical protein